MAASLSSGRIYAIRPSAQSQHFVLRRKIRRCSLCRPNKDRSTSEDEVFEAPTTQGPSIDTMTLNMEEAKAHLKEHGWVRIPWVLSKEEAEDALDRLWKAKSASEASGENTFQPILDPNPSNVRVFHLPELGAYWRDMLVDPTALDLAKSLLGEQLLVSNFSANSARPGAESMALDSDQSIVLPAPWLDIWAVNVIWCLTRTTKENGATLYIPGSNKWTTWDDVPDNAPELLVPFEADAGDIVAIDGRLWHTSGSNDTKDENRAILFAYYSAPHMRLLTNWSAKLPKELQETLGQQMKELLGLSHIGNIPEQKGNL